MDRKETFVQFCTRWLRKASNYQGNELSDLFDKFFTLFVVFNRCYIEAVKIILKSRPDWIKKKHLEKINQAKRDAQDQKRSLPHHLAFPSDKECATRYIVRYCDAELRNKFRSECHASINQLVSMINEKRFFFYEDYLTNQPDHKTDPIWAIRIATYDPVAVLTLVYQARCNMFHGEKEFEVAQRELLLLLNEVLEVTIHVILKRLIADDRFVS